MSQENVDIVRRLYAAIRSGPADETIEVALALMDPAGEFRSRVAAVEGRDYLGHEGVRSYFADVSDAFVEWRNEPGEIVEVAPNAVLADSTFHGIGKLSGMPIEMTSAIAFVLFGGKVVRCLSYATREEAFAAAGLTR